MIWIIILISFILEGFIPNFVSNNTLFNNCFTLISLIIIYPYFKNDFYKFHFIALILGLIVDIAYTDMLFFNAFLYSITSYFIRLFYNEKGFIINTLMIVGIISIYRLIGYILLYIVGYLPFSINVLVSSIITSLILNILYFWIFKILLNFNHKKIPFKIKKTI